MANRKNIYSTGLKILTTRIKEMRLAAGITQVEMAKQLGKVSHTSVLKYEQGQVRIEYLELRRICLICGVQFRDFVDEVEAALEESEQRSKVVPDAPSTDAEVNTEPSLPP